MIHLMMKSYYEINEDLRGSVLNRLKSLLNVHNTQWHLKIFDLRID